MVSKSPVAFCLTILVALLAGCEHPWLIGDGLVRIETQQQQMQAQLGEIRATLDQIRLSIAQPTPRPQSLSATPTSNAAMAMPVRTPSNAAAAPPLTSLTPVSPATVPVAAVGPIATPAPPPHSNVFAPPAARSPANLYGTPSISVLKPTFTRLEIVQPLPPPHSPATASPRSEPSAEARPSTAGMKLRLPGDVYFGAGRADLSLADRAMLARTAEVIKRQYPTATVRIEGFTDEEPIQRSRWDSNDDLSRERSLAVKRFLESQGLPNHQVEAVAMGASHPRSSKELSRRAEISVILDR